MLAAGAYYYFYHTGFEGCYQQVIKNIVADLYKGANRAAVIGAIGQAKMACLELPARTPSGRRAKADFLECKQQATYISPQTCANRAWEFYAKSGAW